MCCLFNKLLKISIFCIAFLIINCTKEIDYPFEEYQDIIIVNSIIQPDSIISVKLSKNFSVLQPDSLIPINYANIIIFENGLLIDSLFFLENGKYLLNNVKPKENCEYSIIINEQGFPQLSAKTKISASVEFMFIDTNVILENKEFLNSILEVIIEIKDPSEHENYYMLEAFTKKKRITTTLNENDEFLKEDTTFIYKPLIIPTLDPIVEIVFDGTFRFNEDEIDFETLPLYPTSLFFTDKLLNSTSNNFIFQIQDPYRFGGDLLSNLYIHLSTISKEYFELIKSLAAYEKNSKMMFSEPLKVYSNINNGAGYFISKNTFIDSLIINSWKDIK